MLSCVEHEKVYNFLDRQYPHPHPRIYIIWPETMVSMLVQSTLVISKSKRLLNNSRYPYLDISDLQN